MLFYNRHKDVDKIASNAETWSGRATILIFFGIAIEIFLIFYFPHGADESEKFSLVLANFLIGAGLIIEYFCIRASVKANTEIKLKSDARVTEALERAVNSENALLQFRKPRREFLSANARSIIKSRLSAYALTPFDIGMGNSDGEIADTAWDLEEILNEAGWSQLPWRVHTVGITVIQRSLRPVAGMVAAKDIEVSYANEEEKKLAPAAAALIGALDAVGIRARIAPLNTPNTNTHALHISVGPKQ